MKGNFKIFKEGTGVSHGQTLQDGEQLGVGGGGHLPGALCLCRYTFRSRAPSPGGQRSSLCDHYVTTSEPKYQEREPEVPGNRQ